MSLRLRMMVVVFLALLALAVAGLSLLAIVRSSHAVTLASVSAHTESAALTLAQSAPPGLLAAPMDTAENRDALLAHATSVLLPLTDTRGGYCFRDGDFLEAEAGSFQRGRPPPAPPPPPSAGADPQGPQPGAPPHLGPGDPPPPPRDDHRPKGPPPHVRDALVDACKRAEASRVERREIVGLGDSIVLIVMGIDDKSAAFALRVVPAQRGGRGALWWAVLAGLPLVTLIIVAVMIETMTSLRRGIRDLQMTMTRLGGDLRTDVVRPHTKELSQIADELHRLALSLAEARDRERALERKVAHQTRLGSLGRLVAGVAHEIRNPLTGIKLLLDGMRKRDLDPKSAGDVRTCQQEIKRLNDLVSAFLGVAREAHGEPELFDVAQLADERLAALADLAASRNVRVVRRGSRGAFAERNVVLQILDNLLRNAVEASPSGEEVEILLSEDGQNTILEVLDRGEGVPPRLVENLFEPFVTSKPGGTGLGLWLSYTAATSRGHELIYHRASGVTRFSLTLPGRPT